MINLLNLVPILFLEDYYLMFDDRDLDYIVGGAPIIHLIGMFLAIGLPLLLMASARASVGGYHAVDQFGNTANAHRTTLGVSLGAVPELRGGSQRIVILNRDHIDELPGVQLTVGAMANLPQPVQDVLIQRYGLNTEGHFALAGSPEEVGVIF